MHHAHSQRYGPNTSTFFNWQQPGLPYGVNRYQHVGYPGYNNGLQYSVPPYHKSSARLPYLPMHSSDYETKPYSRQPSSDFGPLVPHGRQCAQCTYHAETGWLSYMEQGAMAPMQYSHPAGMDMNQPQQYGPIYQELHHTGQSAAQHESHYIPCSHLDATSSGFAASPPATSETSEMPSLVAPPDVFGRISPVPTLSDCSTRSMSSGLRSSGVWGDLNETPLYPVYGPGYTWSSGPASGVWTNMPQAYHDYGVTETSSSANQSFTSSISTDSSSRCSPMEPRYNYAPQAPTSNQVEDMFTATSTATGPVSHLEERFSSSQSRDQLLVRWKLAGMSYKEIKAKGRFKEAESTLRGRFRALTKDPGERVRKPRWTKRDIKLLREGVQKLSVPTLSYRPAPATLRSASSSSRRKSKMQKRQQVIKLRTPWKEVAEYISEHGGSYHFGNATCRKKWDEVNAEDDNNDETDDDADIGNADADGSEGEDESIDGGDEDEDEED